MVEPEDILFVGQSADARCYHRIMLPAIALGCGWCGLDSPPPRMTLGRGEVSVRRRASPDLSGYRIVVLHSPWQEGWSDLIAELQAGGTGSSSTPTTTCTSSCTTSRSSRRSRRCSACATG